MTIPQAAIDAAAQAMHEAGWTCEAHEPLGLGNCEQCADSTPKVVQKILEAAMPAIRDMFVGQVETLASLDPDVRSSIATVLAALCQLGIDPNDVGVISQVQDLAACASPPAGFRLNLDHQGRSRPVAVLPQVARELQDIATRLSPLGAVAPVEIAEIRKASSRLIDLSTQSDSCGQAAHGKEVIWGG